MLNFNDIASKKIEDIEKPPLPPIGTYRWQITKLPETTFSADEQWQFLAFPCRAVEATEDADMSDYNGDVKGIMSRVQFVFNRNDEAAFNQTVFRVRTFLEDHVKCATPTMSINEAINASVNQQFLGGFVHQLNKKTDELNGQITKTAPLD